MPLSDSAVRNAKPGTKIRKLADERGMYLEISPANGKWWRLKYRFAGKEKRLSLGVFPGVSLKDARVRRDVARALLASGIDPSEHRKARKLGLADKAANSFEVVAIEWLSKYSPSWAASHRSRKISLFLRDIFPYLVARPVADVTAPELLAVIRRIETRDAMDTAHRALGSCGQVFRYAIATGRALRDPSRDLLGALAPVKASISPRLRSPTDSPSCCGCWTGTRAPWQCAVLCASCRCCL